MHCVIIFVLDKEHIWHFVELLEKSNISFEHFWVASKKDDNAMQMDLAKSKVTQNKINEVMFLTFEFNSPVKNVTNTSKKQTIPTAMKNRCMSQENPVAQNNSAGERASHIPVSTAY